MTRNVMAFDRRTPADEICECLLANDFHLVPILDRNRLVGIVGRSDILKKRVSALKPR
mgnify:CR=1 FL=1